MNAFEIETQFWLYVEEARAIDLRSDSQLDYEHIMIHVIELAQSLPEHRQVFIDSFISIIKGSREASQGFVPFCMRTLQYPEVLEALYGHMEKTRGTSDFMRSMNFYSEIIHSFQDSVWEQADFWPFYRKEQKKAEQGAAANP